MELRSNIAAGVTAAAMAVSMGGGAMAASVNIVTNDTTQFLADELTGFATTGADMDGMGVDDGSGAISWADLDSDSGGVTGTGWSLRVDGDTFAPYAWTLTVEDGTELTSLFLDGTTGNTIFDRTNPNSGTPGSASGRDFALGSSFDSLIGTVNVTYSGNVGVGSNTPLADLYAFLNIDFTGLSDGFLGAGTYTFSQDTDNAVSSIEPSAIPLPAAAWMLLAGIGGLGVMRRRQQRAEA